MKKIKPNPNNPSTWTFPGQPVPKRVRKVQPVTDELYKWIKDAVKQ